MPQDLQDAIPKADREDVDTAIDQSHELADLMHSLSYAADGTTKGVEVKEAARIASYGLAQSMSPSAAVKTVTAALTTDKYDFWRNGSGIATVPRGTLSDVEASADDLLSGLKGSDLARPLYLSPAATKDVSPDAIERAQLLAAQGGTWVRNPRDDGLVRLDSNGFPVQLANGQPPELRFSDVKPRTAVERLVEAAKGYSFP